MDLVGFLKILAPLCLSILVQGQHGLSPVRPGCVGSVGGWLSEAQSGRREGTIGVLEPRVGEMG